jgi:hypothetical protein
MGLLLCNTMLKAAAEEYLSADAAAAVGAGWPSSRPGGAGACYPKRMDGRGALSTDSVTLRMSMKLHAPFSITLPPCSTRGDAAAPNGARCRPLRSPRGTPRPQRYRKDHRKRCQPVTPAKPQV